MRLSTEIEAAILNFRNELPAEINALLEQGAGEISAMLLAESSLKVGDEAPDFSLVDKEGGTKSLADYLHNGPVVLTFYRGIWCPYCNIQLAAYLQVIDSIRKLGADLVAITPEGPDANEVLDGSNLPEEVKSSAIREPEFDVLHDVGNAVAERFGIVFELPEAHKQVMQAMNIDIEKSHGNDKWAFADPATYIVGSDGTIEWRFVPNNYRKRAEPSEILAALEEIN